MSGNLTVSDLANRVGVSPDAVRYYERLGLLAPPARSAAGYRRYDQRAVERLRSSRAPNGSGCGCARSPSCWKSSTAGSAPAATPKRCCGSGWRRSTPSLLASRRCGPGWPGCSPRPQAGLHRGHGRGLVVRAGVLERREVMAMAACPSCGCPCGERPCPCCGAP